jgi:hypothetical protein
MAGAGPNITQGKYDVALSQFALGYRNNALVGELLFPRVSVEMQSNFYWKFDRSNQKTSPDLRPAGTPAQRIDLTISKDTYFCDDHAQEALIPDEERKNFMAGDIQQAKTQLVTDRILLNEEVEIADFATDNANYAAATKRSWRAATSSATSRTRIRWA